MTLLSETLQFPHCSVLFAHMARALRGVRVSQHLLSRILSGSQAQPSVAVQWRPFTAQAEKAIQNVPEGHVNSDLRPVACNIGLNRLRDLTLRHDLCLYRATTKTPLPDIFKGKKVIIFGVPDMGKVCTNVHVPGYVSLAEDLKGLGIDGIFCIAVGTPSDVATWAAGLGLKNNLVEVIADNKGGFVRMLGLELEDPEGPQNTPKSQRYAGLVDNGILRKLKVEETPGNCIFSSAENMLQLIKEFQE